MAPSERRLVRDPIDGPSQGHTPVDAAGGDLNPFKLGGLLQGLMEDGLTEVIEDVLVVFLEDHCERSEVVTDAIDQGDLSRAAAAAHSMISAAGGIGAHALAGACDLLERACRAADANLVEAELAAMKVEEARVLVGVRKFLAEDPSNP